MTRNDYRYGVRLYCARLTPPSAEDLRRPAQGPSPHSGRPEGLWGRLHDLILPAAGALGTAIFFPCRGSIEMSTVFLDRNVTSWEHQLTVSTGGIDVAAALREF
jgi:hypothetical protein